MENNPKNTFRYEPLDSNHAHPIRLLSLFPSPNFAADIECEVFNTGFVNNPKFEALSYTWGNSTDVVPILLHGQIHQVTRNLATALRHLRDSHQAKVLWVDALCINQSDIAERNQQVSKMRDIYAVGGAQRVVVWLGEMPNGQLAIDFCDKLSAEPTVFASLPGYELEWESCHDIFTRNPWWSRAWIVQEVVHTNKVIVHLGDSKPMSFESLCEKFKIYQSRWDLRVRFGDWTDEEVQKVAKPLEKDWPSLMRGIRHQRDSPMNISNTRDAVNSSPPLNQYLPSLLITFRDQAATDFHDKIYAFQCMAFDNPSRNDIPVDYRLSKEEIYTIVSRAFIRKNMIPLLLAESEQKPVSSNSELASWVTDFTTKQGYVQTYHIVCATKFNASKGFPVVEMEPRLLDPLECKILRLRGIFVATITGVFQTRITQDEDLVGVDSVTLIRFSEDCKLRFRDFTTRPQPPWKTRGAQEDSPIISHTNTSWGPIFSEVGDIIIVIAGFTLPLVLRMFEKGKYLFVGACLLIEREIENCMEPESDRGYSDIMHGRVCEGLPKDYEAEVFCIY